MLFAEPAKHRRLYQEPCHLCATIVKMSDLHRAIALMGSKQHAAALPLLQNALRRSEQKPGGPSSTETASVLYSIGECYRVCSDFQAAAGHFHRAAAVGNYDFYSRITASLNAITALFNITAYAEAEAQISISLSMLDAEAATGTTTPALLKGYRADTSNQSAAILQMAGRYSEALPLFVENVAYYEAAGDTPKLIHCLINLGLIYFRQGLSEKALAVARRAHSLNPRSVTSLSQLGILLSQLSQYNDALACLHKALECEDREYGKNTMQYARILEQIGTNIVSLSSPTWPSLSFSELEQDTRNLTLQRRLISECCWSTSGMP